MLEVEALTKKFKKTSAVDKVSFVVRPGEIFGLLGADGAGKTTVMRMIALLMMPSSGNLRICGTDALKNPTEAAERIGLFSAARPGLIHRLTVKENIMFFAGLHNMPKGDAARRMMELADDLGLSRFVNRRVDRLPEDLRLKTAICCAFIHDPDVMLFDEPTYGTDIGAAWDIQDFITGCREKNKTVLISSSKFDEVNKLCNRVGILISGAIAEQGTVGEICRNTDALTLDEAFIMLYSGGDTL